MFIEPTITWVPSGFSVYIWFGTKIVFKKRKCWLKPETSGATVAYVYNQGLKILRNFLGNFLRTQTALERDEIRVKPEFRARSPIQERSAK